MFTHRTFKYIISPVGWSNLTWQVFMPVRRVFLKRQADLQCLKEVVEPEGLFRYLEKGLCSNWATPVGNPIP